jgi:hypothetical protein
MGYGGKQASRSGDIRRFNFTGNGSNTAFDLGFTPATQNQLIVTVNGLVQHYDAFSISGSTITFDGTPASGDTIQITAVVDAVGVAAIPDGAVANVSTLAVSGAATFSNTVTVVGNTTFSNTTAHTGAAMFSNTVAVTGNLSTTSQLLANGDIKGITATNPTIWSANSAALTDGSMYMQFNTTSSEGRLGSYTNHPLVLLTNNTRQVIIDGSGRVTTPYQPSFYVSDTSSSTTIQDEIKFTTTAGAGRHNTGSHYSTSTGRFTAPVTGYYQMSYVIRANNTSGYLHPSFRINNASQTHTRTIWGGTLDYKSLTYTAVFYLTAGDYISTSTGDSQGGLGGALETSQCSFSGRLVG